MSKIFLVSRGEDELFVAHVHKGTREYDFLKLEIELF